MTTYSDVSSWLPSNFRSPGWWKLCLQYVDCNLPIFSQVGWVKEVLCLATSEIFMVQAWKWHLSLLPHIPLDRIQLPGYPFLQWWLRNVIWLCVSDKWVWWKQYLLLWWSWQWPLYFWPVPQRKEPTWDTGLPLLIVAQEGYPVSGLSFALIHLAERFPLTSLAPQFLYATDELYTPDCDIYGEIAWVTILISGQRRETNRWTVPHSWPNSS